MSSQPLDWPGYGRELYHASRIYLGTTPGNVFPISSFICLASMAGMVLLIDCHFLEIFPKPLQELLMDPRVKVGGYWAMIQEALFNRFPEHDQMLAKSIIQVGIPPIDPTEIPGSQSIVPVDLLDLIEFFMGPVVEGEVLQMRQHWALLHNNPSSGLLPLTARNEPDLLMQCLGRTAIWTLDVLLMQQAKGPNGERPPVNAYDWPKLFHRLVSTLGTQVKALPSANWVYRLQDLQSPDNGQPIMRPITLRFTLHEVIISFHQAAPYLGNPYVHENLQVCEARDPTFKAIQEMLLNQVDERGSWFVAIGGEEMATQMLWARTLDAPGLAGSLNLSIAPIGST